MLTTQGLNAEKSKEVLQNAGLIASENAIQAELLESTLIKAELNKEEREAILNKLGLIQGEGAEAIVQGTCTKADLEAVLAQKLKNAEDAEGIIKALGLAGANTTTTASFGLLTKGIWANIKAMAAWMISNPLGWIILLGGTIAATVGLVDLFTTSVEEHREKLENLKSEYSDVKSELDGLKGELDGTQSRINELESKGKLTFTEAEELNNLRKQNNELQRSIDLLELQNKTKKKELNDQFVETMNSDIEQELYTRNENDEVVQYMPMSGQTATDDNEADYINQRFKDLQKLRDELASASTEAEKERINRQIKGIEDYFIQKNKDFTETAESIDYIQNPTTEDDKKVNEWLDYINDFQDKMAVAMGGENAKENAFNRLVDNWKFDELLNPLQQLGKEGKVTLDDLKSRMSDPVFAEFVNKLVEIGVISDTTDGSLRYLANAFNGTAISARNYVTSLKGNDLNNFIDNLGEEAKALGTTESELAKLTAAHVIFNNTGLSTEQQQRALQTLAQKIATTSSEMKYLLRLFNIASMDSVDELVAQGRTRHEALRQQANVRKYLKDKYGIDLSPIEIPEKDVPSNSSTDDTDKAEKEALEKFKESLETREKIFERYKKAIDLTDFGLDLAEENDFALRADLLNNKMSQLTSYGHAMREEFDRISSIIPETGEEAESLGSILESLGDNMRENITALRKTQVAMEQLKIDSLVSVGDYYLNDLESELDSIEKRIERLNKDNKEDYKYTNQILSMKTLLPTKSGLEGARNANRRNDIDIINSAQETQNIVNDILEAQIGKNEKLRESERASLLADMEQMRNDTQLKLNSMSVDYQNSWNDVQSTTNTGVNNIEGALNGMDIKIPAPDISQVVKACEIVRDMLNRIGDDSYSPPTIQVSDGINGGDATSIIRGNKANIVTNIAKNQERANVPYVWGGVAPYVGLDCSGLTQYAYGVAGVTLPRRSQEQWTSAIGTRVDWSDLKKGDQLFFGNNGEATHTGIYVGNGQMIHAPSTGKNISYQSIENEYYQGMFLGAKRYASGTIQGNMQASKFGIAGENFKPEILIDKATGKRTYIDKPTVIDVSKTDVIGEKETANLPKFASGTISPYEIASYIRNNYPEITDVGIAAILANIQQESGFNPKNKTIEAYGSGSSKPIARWGLFQLDDTRIPNWSDIVNNGTWQQQIDTALAEGRYSNSGMGNLSKYNVWDNVLTNTSLSAGEAAKLFDSLFERSDGKSSTTRAINAEKYYSQIQDNTIALENNTSAINEESNSINEFVDSKVSEINQATIGGRLSQLQILNNETISDEQKQVELFNVYKPIAANAARVATESYSQLLQEFNQYVIDVNNGVKKYDQEVVDSYLEGLSALEDIVLEYEEGIISIRDNLISYAEKRVGEIDDYIAERNLYNDWHRYGDTELKAIGRQMSEYRALLNAGVINDDKYRKLISPLEQNAYSLGKDKLFKAIDNLIAKEERLAEKEKKRLDLQTSKLSSRQTLLQSYYNVVNNISDAYHEINKDLEASKLMHEYLNEDTRQLLFNQKDYNKLSKELLGIQKEADKLQRAYERDIRRASADNIAEITSQYQMQYETLMKSYEISKANLEVTKKQQQLNNVLKERNVRMFVNGNWQWMANTQDVINAQSELADAKYEASKSKTSLSQQNELNELQFKQDSITTQINFIDSDLEKFRTQFDKLQEQINGQSQVLSSVLTDIVNSDVPALQEILTRFGNSLASLVTGITGEELSMPMVDYMKKILEAKSDDEVKAWNRLRNIKISNAKPSDSWRREEMLTDDEAIRASNFIPESLKTISEKAKEFGQSVSNIFSPLFNRHANGTRHTKNGNALIGEAGSEVFLSKNGHLTLVDAPTMFKNVGAGGAVFNQDQMSNIRYLWDLSNYSSSELSSMIKRNPISTTGDTNCNNITINGMTVDSGSQDGQALLNALRRYVGNH